MREFILAHPGFPALCMMVVLAVALGVIAKVWDATEGND